MKKVEVGSYIKFLSNEITYWFSFYGWKDRNFKEKKYYTIDLFPCLVVNIDTIENSNNLLVGLLHPRNGIFYVVLDGDKIQETNYTFEIISFK